jgi:hypothetical protein
MSTKPKSNPNPKPKPPEIIELDAPAVAEIRQRIAARQLTEQDYEIFTAILAAYCFLVNLLTSKRITIARLKKLLFGARTETTEAVLGSVANGTTLPGAGEDDRRDASNSPPSGAPPKRRKGHGRNGADDYPGAQRIVVPHESLQPDDNCLECQDGTLYELPRPATLIRIVGQAPVQATIYELQRLRCKLCGAVFTAQVPEGVGPDKYDATVASIIGLLKYGRGVPFYRLAGLQQDLGIPLPAATQWKVAHEAVPSFEPAYQELIRQAAGGEVVYHDDTNNRILELMGKRWAKAQAQEAARAAEREAGEEAPPDPGSERRGIFTSGIVSTCAGQRIALFFTGRKHAGENLRDVLAQRAKQLAPPIQMCDPLSRNMPAELNTILANCLAHGRRQFADVVEHFPDECRYVLESLKVVYQNDAVARQKQLSPEARLQFHKSQSGPVMDDLQAWLQRQIDEHLVEPNSGLGEAINYLLKRWDKFTLFLRQAGAPLDNNLCERALKKVILHRKNAMFYKTENGAHTGDIYMSLIYTCELCGANPFDYLTELQRHAQEVAANPACWMPWNYRQTLAVVPAVTSPPATAPATPWTTVP